MLHRRLMASAALAALCASSPSFAQSADPGVAADAQQEIVVIARGETRQVQSITGEAIAIKVPGTSPLKAIEKLPGVSFQSADPFGAYEWSTRISIRGFSQNQLGFTLDGVPLGDMSYGNHNGLHISRAISSENVSQVDVTQGAGSLGTASTNNLGGTLQFFSRDPAETFGGLAAFTGGSDTTLRGFARVDTGRLGTGTRAYLSYGQSTADKWKGDGQQEQKQANFKLVQDIGAGKLTGFLNWSDRRENDYQDLSLGMINRLGYKWDNLAPDFAKAVLVADIANNRGDTGAPVSNAAAGTVYPAPIQTVDDAYYDASGLRKDFIGGVTLDYPITDRLDFKVTGYGHNNDGRGLWYTPYVPSPSGVPISIRTTEYQLKRYGVISSLTGRFEAFGHHEVTGGVWYENNSFNQSRRFYGLTSLTAPTRQSLDWPSDPFFTQWHYNFQTITRQFYVQDDWKPIDIVTVSFGFKSVKVGNTAEPITDSAPISGSIVAQDDFLPQAGVKIDLTKDHNLFANYTENMRAFQAAKTTGPFSTTQDGFNAIKSTLKPETSQTYEIGWRGRFGSTLQATVAGYHVNFDNRLLGITTGAGIIGNPVVLQNVGGVTTDGIEVAAIWTFVEHWSAFGSFTYDDSKYDDNVLTAGGAIPTRHKYVVDTPKHMAKAELSYDDTHLFGTVGVSYTGKRYFTYTNDQSVDGYALVDLTLGYRFSGAPWLEGTELQLNATNLTDEEYVSTIGSNGFTNAGDSQTLLAGSPRQIFVTLRKEF